MKPERQGQISKIPQFIPITNPPFLSPLLYDLAPPPPFPPLHLLNHITGKILGSLPIITNLLSMKTI